jgi:hypothetical protein
VEKFAEDQHQQSLLSVTVDANGYRIHTLIDDIVRPIRRNRAVVMRDPMVEALFGPAVVARQKKPAPQAIRRAR